MGESPTHRSEPAALELDHVSRVFDGDSTTGITDITLTVRAGEFVSIVGPSGAGKSTLLNVLGLLDNVTEGSYRVFGNEVSALGESGRNHLRSEIFGFVFQQSFVLADASTLENAALGLRVQNMPLQERTAKAAEALSKLGMRARANTPGRVLSGGEQQRVAIARAIATQPLIILADEPTGNLDSRNGAAVLDYLHQLNKEGATVILITHDETIADTTERKIRIVDGTIVGDHSSTPRARCTHESTPASSRAHHPSLRSSRRPRMRRIATTIADDVSESLNVISGRIGRTLFLMLAFSLGVGGLVSSLGVSESASAQVSQRLSAAALDEVRVKVPGGAEMLDTANPQLAEWMSSARDVPHVKGVGYVAHAGASSASIRRLSPDEADPGLNVVLMSASPEYLQFAGVETTGPETISLLGNSTLSNVALIGTDVAASLKIPPPGPGSTLWINGKLVDVVGVINPGEREPGLRNAVVVSGDVIQASSTVEVSLVVRTESGYPASVADVLPAALDAGNPGQFDIETVADLRNLRFGVATDLGQLIGVISLILLGLAGISAATTMYLSVQSRAHEIALRRAVGSSRSAVGRLFIIEGTVIGVVGGAVGAALGTALTLLLVTQQGWDPVLAPWLPLAGVMLGMGTGLLSSVVPAVMASKQAPALAIRAR